MGLTDIGHGFRTTMEGGGAEHEQAGVDEEGETQRERGIPGGETHGLAPLLVGPTEVTGRDDRRVQVEVMRHDRRADDAERHEEHAGAGQHVGRGNKALHEFGDDGLGQQELDADAGRDGQDQHGDE